MTSDHETKNEDEELEEGDSETASIDDSMLDELSDDPVDADEPEGFGHIKETPEEEEEEEKETGLEEDAEDVDYDSFDDEDHL